MSFKKLLRQVQNYQSQIGQSQGILEEKIYDGKSGNNSVSVVINGKGEFQSLNIDPALLVPDEKEILEDLIIVAFNDAKRKLDVDMEQNTQNILGNMFPGNKMN